MPNREGPPPEPEQHPGPALALALALDQTRDLQRHLEPILAGLDELEGPGQELGR